MALVRGLGFSSVICEDSDFEHLGRNLDEAERLKADFVELPFFNMDLIAGGKVLRDQLRRLRQVTAGRGCSYTAHAPIAINFMDGPELLPRHMSVAKASIEAAAELGCVHVILHTGHLPAGNEVEIEAAYRRQREALIELGSWAAEHSLILAVENIFTGNPAHHTALPSRLAQEIDAIGSANVRACLDFSHAALRCGASNADYMTEIKSLARVAKHLHLHDSFGLLMPAKSYSRAERMAYGIGDLHLPIGWGDIAWDRLMSECSFEHDVIFNLELPLHFWFKLSDCVEAMRAMIARYEEARGEAP